MIGKSYKPINMVKENKEITKEMEQLWEALRPKEEPPADCTTCERRHSECAEYAALNPGYVKMWGEQYNRGSCHWYRPEQVSKVSKGSKEDV